MMKIVRIGTDRSSLPARRCNEPRRPRSGAKTRSPRIRRVLATIVARVLDLGYKLATARGLAAATARDSLAETLGLGDGDEDDLYAAMDWLLERQEGIERRFPSALAQRIPPRILLAASMLSEGAGNNVQ